MKNRQTRHVETNDDAKVAEALKAAVAALCARMNEAEKLGIEVSFNIGRGPDGNGSYVVSVCNVTKRL